MRLLVTGAEGMLGTDVVAAAATAGHEALPLARRDLDITDPDAVLDRVRDLEADAIVNAAAWTDVDGAEAHEADATRVNGDGPGHLAAAAAATGAHLVHVSTDYVFDGAPVEGGYTESGPVGPVSAYGRSKLAGEVAVAAAGPGHSAVVRTAWVFGAHGRNFVDTMLRLAADRDTVTVVDDQVGCPTWTGHLAPALVAVAAARTTGVLHVAGGGSCSWWELAVATFEAAGLPVTVQRGRSADLDRPAPRPPFSVLASTRPEAPALPHWREGLLAHLSNRKVLA